MVRRVVHGERVARTSSVPGGIDNSLRVQNANGKVGLVMAVTVLTLEIKGTESSSVSLLSVSKWITTIGSGTGEYGWAASDMGEY